MYRVIKSDFVKLSNPRVISAQRDSLNAETTNAMNETPEVLQSVAESAAVSKKPMVSDEVSEKFYKLLR